MWNCQKVVNKKLNHIQWFSLCQTMMRVVAFNHPLITDSAPAPGSQDDSTYIVQTLDFHLGHNTMVTKPCGALESPMATITKITRRRHENPPHGVATVKEWFNYVTAMRNEGNWFYLSTWIFYFASWGHRDACSNFSHSNFQRSLFPNVKSEYLVGISLPCLIVKKNQSEIATAHFKINVDLCKKMVFRGSGVLFDFK